MQSPQKAEGALESNQQKMGAELPESAAVISAEQSNSGSYKETQLNVLYLRAIPSCVRGFDLELRKGFCV